MPIYPGSGLAKLINANKQVFLFQNERIAGGTASIAFQLERQKAAAYPWGAAVEVSFSAAPGTVAIDVQGSETDTAASFCTLGSSIAAVNASNYARFEILAYYPKFVRVLVKTLTNDVLITATLTR